MTKKLNIVVDIGHPAHVHLFRNFIPAMAERGHKVFVLSKDTPSIRQLLDIYRIPYLITGSKPDSIIKKYLSQLAITFKTIRFIIKYRIDTGIGISMTLPIVKKFTGIKVVGMDDDDVSVTPVFARFINRSDVILTPDCLGNENRGPNHIVYPAYHELAYLHPNRFTPDPGVPESAGVKQGEPYFVLRFNAFKAHHDTAARGLSKENKLALIGLLKSFGKVFITAEQETDPEFEKYRLPVSPEKIHSLLFYAKMFIGDSQTMTTEAALLGTPAFKCNTFAGKLSIPNEIERRYQLCFAYQPEDFNKMLSNIKMHLELPNLKEIFAERRARLLSEKTDLTDFLIDLVENKL